jgi:[acyl-carrier-protein] S-malonyltransferase
MRPSRLALICAGQGQQAELKFELLRPRSSDHDDYRVLWDCFNAACGGDFAEAWSALSVEQRNQNQYAQLGVVAWQVLRYLRYREAIPKVAWVLGYSVGELSAHAIAGSIPLKELVPLVQSRAQYMDQAVANPQHLPCLVLLSEHLPPQARTDRNKALEHWGLELAIHRSHAESVWGGTPEGVASFLKEAKTASWNVRPIDVRVPSHTSYLSSAAPLWKEKLSAAWLKEPQIPVLSGISAEPIMTIGEIQNALSIQLKQTIRWDDCLLAMQERGVSEVWDLGPGQDQSRLVTNMHSDIKLIEVCET